MKVSDILGESPEMISDLGTGLANKKINKEKFQLLFNNPKKEILEKNERSELVRVPGNPNRIALLNLEQKTIDYQVDFEEQKHFAGTYVVQISVWKRNGAPLGRGMADKVFFEYLLLEYKSIMSDEMQTPDGKRFWIDMMGISLAKGFKVGLANLKTNTINWCKGDLEDWLKENNGWFNDERGLSMRYIISNS